MKPLTDSRFIRTAAKVLLVVVVVGAVIVGRRRIPVEVEARAVDRGPVVQEVTGPGSLESPMEVAIGFETGGRIATLLVDEGMEVRAGQVLGTLDTSEAERQLASAIAARALSRAGIGRARAELGRAHATLRGAGIERDRALSLSKTAAISGQGRDAVLDRYAVAEADVTVLEAGVLQAEGAERVARENVELHRQRVSDGRMVSPINGLVVRRHHEPGQIVAAGTPVLTLVATDKLWVRTWIDETALGALRVGLPARVELRSQPGVPLRARVDRIGRQADRQTHELLVDVELIERPKTFAIGQRADVYIAAEEKPAVVRVPEGFCDTLSATCLVEQGGRAVRRPVRLGVIGTGFVEVAAGLTPGERVLRPRGATDHLEEGRPVRFGSES